MKNILFISVLAVSLCSGISYAEGLQTLIQAGKSMGEIQKALAEETRSYEQVKQGVDSGRIKRGASKNDIIAEYGEPVVSNTDAQTNREKFIYMPATSSAFSGPKIYLYFGNNDTLDEIVVRQ